MKFERCILFVQYSDAGFLIPETKYGGRATAEPCSIESVVGQYAYGFAVEIVGKRIFARCKVDDGRLQQR